MVEGALRFNSWNLANICRLVKYLDVDPIRTMNKRGLAGKVGLTAEEGNTEDLNMTWDTLMLMKSAISAEGHYSHSAK